MRLLFICSSQEPGRDGVGDYVRLLAEACAQLGHSCAIVALNDPFVAGPTASPVKSAGGDIPCLRLAGMLPWAQRVELARKFRVSFQPHWVSFHFVPYAFHPRGLVRREGGFLAVAGAAAPLHLMFHELWLGAGRPSPLSHFIIGPFQRRGIRRLIRLLKPRLVTTSNPAYAEMLRPICPDVSLLPLFGNIPLASSPPPLGELLAGSGIAAENRADWWIGIFFGSLHEEWKPEPFLGRLLDVAREKGRRLCLVQAGRAGAAGEAIWSEMKKRYGGQITFLDRGEQPAGIISALLQAADFGIAASPWQLIGKSGTAAAMIDHGLPVIVTRDDFQPFLPGEEPPSSHPLVHRWNDGLAARLAAGLPKSAPAPRAAEIAARWLARLNFLSPP